MNHSFSSSTCKWLGALCFAAALMAVAASSGAGQDNAEFTSLWDLLEGWATGTLGKVIAIATLLVGMAIGIVRQSVIAVVVVVAIAVALVFGPGVINGIFTAVTVPDPAQLVHLTNGLS